MDRCLAAVVKKAFSQKLRKELEILEIRDSSHRLAAISDTDVAIPVLNSDSIKHYKNGEYYVIKGIQFCLENIQLPRSKNLNSLSPYKRLCDSLKELLAVKNIPWTSELAQDIPHKWEQHGDLILLPSGSFSMEDWQLIANELYIKVCEVLGAKRLAKKSVVCDDNYRSSQVNLLVGDNGWVKHTDNGIIYTYDVTHCMFSAGNITEKLRIASFDCSNETVVDMFAGIGYFTLPYLIHAHASKVYACEWNPHAVEALKQNLVLNRVDSRCEVLEGDNRVVCPKCVADRVNLGLIPSSESSWPAACMALKSTGGILHIHGNVTDKKNTDSAAEPVKPVEDPIIPADRQQQLNRSEQCSIPDSHCSSHILDLDFVSLTSSDFISVAAASVKQNQRDADISDTGTSDILRDLNKQGEFSRKFEKKVKHNMVWTTWARDVCSQIEAILCELHKKDWFCRVRHIEHVKSYAPHIDHLVVDLECKPLDR